MVAIAAGAIDGPSAMGGHWKQDRSFTSDVDEDERGKIMNRWHAAVERSATGPEMKQMKRKTLIEQATAGKSWDVIVIGGGASGLGTAVDAASRGYRTLLLEQADFAKATSSRSTKLVHGGVRYLQQGNISLVREALHERGLLYVNAPHLVTNLAFVVPRYKWWEGPFYGIGLKLYDLLAGKLNLSPSKSLNAKKTMELIPNLEEEGLDGGTRYSDGQFDDARMCATPRSNGP